MKNQQELSKFKCGVVWLLTNPLFEFALATKCYSHTIIWKLAGKYLMHQNSASKPVKIGIG